MQKVKRVRTTVVKQASQFLKPVPPKIAKLIDLVNLVPPDFELPHPDDIDTTDWCIKPQHDECTAKALKSFKKQFPEGIPIELKRYLWQNISKPFNEEFIQVGIDRDFAKSLNLTAEQALEINELLELGNDPVLTYEKITNIKASESKIWELKNYSYICIDPIPAQYHVFEKYSYFWDTRQSLNLIANLSNSPIEQKERIRKLYDWNGVGLPIGSSKLYIDDQGHFRATKDPVIDALEGVEAARIRKCETCARIFWAGRIDQKCCSKKCAQVQRTRRWRERYQNNYKLRRNGYEPIGENKTVTNNKKVR